MMVRCLSGQQTDGVKDRAGHLSCHPCISQCTHRVGAAGADVQGGDQRILLLQVVLAALPCPSCQRPPLLAAVEAQVAPFVILPLYRGARGGGRGDDGAEVLLSWCCQRGVLCWARVVCRCHHRQQSVVMHASCANRVGHRTWKMLDWRVALISTTLGACIH